MGPELCLKDDLLSVPAVAMPVARVVGIGIPIAGSMMASAALLPGLRSGSSMSFIVSPA
jgi:hypothetical protein